MSSSDEAGEVGDHASVLEKRWTGKHQGFLNKKSNSKIKKNWKKYWFVLSMYGRLLIFKHPSAPKPKRMVNLEFASIKATVPAHAGSSKHPNSFQILPRAGNEVMVEAATAEEKDAWLEHLRKVVSENSVQQDDD